MRGVVRICVRRPPTVVGLCVCWRLRACLRARASVKRGSEAGYRAHHDLFTHSDRPRGSPQPEL